MEIPEFSPDSTEQTLDADDDQSNSPIKGAIKWEKNAGKYVFLWWQTPFYIATPNGGYSMTADLLESLPGHLDTVWVVDDENGVVKKFPRSHWENDSVRVTIDPDSPKFKNVVPAKQYAVDCTESLEEFDLSEVESLH